MAPGWQPCVLVPRPHSPCGDGRGLQAAHGVGSIPPEKPGDRAHTARGQPHTALLQLTTASTAGDTTAYTSATTAWLAGEYISDVLIYNIIDVLI